MRPKRREMHDVVLVEGGSAVEGDVAAHAGGDDDEAAPVGEGGSPPGPEPAVARGSWIRRSRWWVAAGVALVLVVVGDYVVTNHRESARMARLSDIPGFLAPLDPPVRELWHTDAGMLLGLAELDGTLFAAETDFADGSVDVIALDPATGADLWRVAAKPADVSSAAESIMPGLGGAQCAFPGPLLRTDDADAARSVACIVTDNVVTVTDAEGTVTIGSSAAHRLMIDAASGRVLSSAPADPNTSLAYFGADLVTGAVEPDGRLRVTRTDAAGEAARWSFTSPDPVAATGADQTSLWVGVIDDVIVASAMSSGSGEGAFDGGSSSWVLSATGEVVRTLSDEDSGRYLGGISVLADGALFVEPTTDGAGLTSTTITIAATGRSFAVEGYPLGPQPDDGSLADLVLVQTSASRELVAYDLGTGRKRWTVQNSQGMGAVIVDDRLISMDDNSLTSIDGRTGAPVWTSPIKHPNSTLLTDGRVVLLEHPGAEGAPTVTAYGVSDGKERWHVELASDLSLSVLGGRLYGWSSNGLTALG